MMKKNYMFLAALATMALSAGAQTLNIGGYDACDNGTGCYEGGAKDESPINYYHKHSASQILYTPEDLGALISDTQNAKISSFSFKWFNSNCFTELTRTVKVFVQEIDATTYVVDNDGDRLFFDFDITKPCATQELTINFPDSYYATQEVTLTLDTPFLYKGKTLVVTVVADGEEATGASHDVAFYANQAKAARGKAMTYALDAASFADYMETNGYPKATMSRGTNSNVDQPATAIAYTMVNKSEPTAVSDVNQDKAVASVTYYNALGMPNAEPYSGLNIVVTRYTDGTVSTVKALR